MTKTTFQLMESTVFVMTGFNCIIRTLETSSLVDTHSFVAFFAFLTTCVNGNVFSFSSILLQIWRKISAWCLHRNNHMLCAPASDTVITLSTCVITIRFRCTKQVLTPRYPSFWPDEKVAMPAGQASQEVPPPLSRKVPISHGLQGSVPVGE